MAASRHQRFLFCSIDAKWSSSTSPPVPVPLRLAAVILDKLRRGMDMLLLASRVIPEVWGVPFNSFDAIWSSEPLSLGNGECMRPWVGSAASSVSINFEYSSRLPLGLPGPPALPLPLIVRSCTESVVQYSLASTNIQFRLYFGHVFPLFGAYSWLCLVLDWRRD